jgi:hypothetical protein
MSAIERKTLIHQRIDGFTDEETVEVYKFIAAYYDK